MGRDGMYFPIHNVPETFDEFVTEFIDWTYITDCTDNYISEFLYIHDLLIVENGPVGS